MFRLLFFVCCGLQLWTALGQPWATSGQWETSVDTELTSRSVSTLHLSLSGFYQPFPPFSLPTLGAALPMALDAARSASVPQNVTLEWHVMNDGCSDKAALDAVVRARFQFGADVLIGTRMFGFALFTVQPFRLWLWMMKTMLLFSHARVLKALMQENKHSSG